VFDLHLYGEASRIPTDIETARGMMRAFGYEKPLVAGEYNAPWPNLYPEATAAMQQALAAAFAAGAGGPAGQGADAGQQTPEQVAIASLYERMASLPPQLQMFMRGCPQELEDKRHRINCREIVMRNLLALSAGVRRTLCWNLAPEVPGYENPLSVMDLLFGKFALLDYRGGELGGRNPSAEAFALLADQLAGVERVTRLEAPARPNLFVFEVGRTGRGPLLVAWEQRDSFHGEDEPPVAFHWPWPAATATAVDAMGQAQPVEVADGRVALPVSLTRCSSRPADAAVVTRGREAPGDARLSRRGPRPRPAPPRPAPAGAAPTR
jgi:hypothetical protein